MKGDFTRSTYDRRKRYSGVLKQQGRVDLDADWNELVAIRDALATTTRTDVIGPCGVPKVGGGFQIGGGADLTISGGRIYVDGILCEIAESTYSTQPFGSGEALIAEGEEAGVDGRTDLVYLDVWERHVTAVEDPELLDPALNGADTTTRLQTVCHVKVAKGVAASGCDDPVADFPPSGTGTGTLSNQAVATPAEADPCDVVVTGGYRGVENRLYRVEIHTPGPLGTATYKWSRDNGAVCLPVAEFPAAPANRVRLASLGRDRVMAVRVGDWIEITDDAAELAGQPGLMAQVTEADQGTRFITLDRDVPAGAFDVARHARVRRWDQLVDVDANGLLTTDAAPEGLEDGVEVLFGGGDFRTGEYWNFAARTAGGSLEPIVNGAPQGPRHHFCPLALVTWADDGAGAFTATVLDDCRPTFPSLTTICAEDVCFDNDVCDLPAAETVQDALDRLCRERDLRFHNKHLHGWGIVCGLQVECGPDTNGTRRSVTVRNGYAIDCEGNDIYVDEEGGTTLDLFERIEAHDADNPNDPLVTDGDGEVCLTVALDGEGVRYDVERFESAGNPLKSVLGDSILMDFWESCVLRVIEFFKKQVTPGVDEDAGDENAPLVGLARRRATTLLNLLIQLFNPVNGRYVYLSLREHEILRTLYDGLRALLQSRTFCAMFAGARPFPDYPFPDDGLTTFFGKGSHTRVRLHPREPRAYTLGADDRLHIYDVNEGEMVAEVQVPGGQGAVLRDVAFDVERKRVYAIASLGDDTVFAVADVDGVTHEWRPVTVICDADLRTLGVSARVPGSVFGVGLGSGLYEINPENVDPKAGPIVEFNASGHLEIHPDGGMAFATANAPDGPTDRYDRIVRVRLQDPVITATFEVSTEAVVRTGDDDIALALRDDVSDKLYAVAEGGGQKVLLAFRGARAANPQPFPSAEIAIEDTAVRLASFPEGPLMVSFEDSYRIALVDTANDTIVTVPQAELTAFRHPVQISPVSLAVAPDGERVYALNLVSNTINRIPRERLRPENQLDLVALGSYRDAILEAFVDLFGGALQYLKDCLCHHFLVDCPDCEDDDRIYLACVSVRGGQIHQVCNFAKRKYVKSFPTVEYWMSIIPVLPMVKMAVQKFCCAVLPDLIGEYEAPGDEGVAGAKVGGNRVKGVQLRQAVSISHRLNRQVIRRDVDDRFRLTRRLGTDWLGTVGTTRVAPETAPPQKRRVAGSDIVGREAGSVKEKLEESGVDVRVVEYDPKRLGKNLLNVSGTPRDVPAGSTVTLYQKDGEVRYFSRETAPAAGDTRAIVQDLTDLRVSVLDQREAQDQLEAALERQKEVNEELLGARSEVEGLKEELAAVRRASEGEILKVRRESEEELLKVREESREALAEVKQASDEALVAVRRESEEALAERDRRITELLRTTESFEVKLRTIDRLSADVERLKQNR